MPLSQADLRSIKNHSNAEIITSMFSLMVILTWTNFTALDMSGDPRYSIRLPVVKKMVEKECWSKRWFYTRTQNMIRLFQARALKPG